MEMKTALAALAIAATAFAGGYWASAKPWVDRAFASERGTLTQFFTGDRNTRIDWCSPENHDLAKWGANFVIRDLDLNADQKARFNALMTVALDSLSGAKALCTADRDAVHARPLDEQVAMLKSVMDEAGTVIGDIEAPFLAFHESLDDMQKSKLEAMIAGHGNMDGHGRWHRRG